MKRLVSTLPLLFLLLLLVPVTASGQDERDSPRPIPMRAAVWLDQMTWMEVRDAIVMGKTTAILPTGGTEANGPYSVTGKHSFIVGSDAEAIARRLGNALVAPVVWFEPGGNLGATGEDTDYPGTFAIRTDVYKEVIRDLADALRQAGFQDIVMIGDNGGNQRPLAEVAAELNRAWAGGTARVHHVPEYYAQHGVIDAMLPDWGVNQVDEGVHDSYRVTATLMAIDPANVRLEERIATGKTSINGVDIVPAIRTIEHGRRMQEIKTLATVSAIRKAIGARTTIH